MYAVCELSDWCGPTFNDGDGTVRSQFAVLVSEMGKSCTAIILAITLGYSVAPTVVLPLLIPCPHS